MVGAMFTKRIGAILLLAMLVSGCQWIDNWRARKDFKNLCTALEEFRPRKESGAEKQMRLAEVMLGAVSSRSAKVALQAIATVSPEMRYEMLKAAAAEVGLPDYRCDAFRKIFVEASEAVEPPRMDPGIDTTPLARVVKGRVTTLTFSEQQMEAMLGHGFSEIITAGRLVPSMSGSGDGKMVGFKLFAIAPGSFYSVAGMENNDIWIAVNGQKLQQPDMGFHFWQSLEVEQKTTLKYRRGTEVHTLVVKVQ